MLFRSPQLLGPSAVTASSATRPMTSPGTCPAGSTAATPSARRVCGGWPRRPPSSAGSPARSAARARPCPAEGWPCWTSIWPPSWPSGPGGGRLAWSCSPRGQAKAAPPSPSSRPGSCPCRAPRPTSPSAEAAAQHAVTSAGIPQAVPSSELCWAPPLGGEPWPAAGGTAFQKQPGGWVPQLPPRVFAEGPPSKVVSCAHGTVCPCRSWNRPGYPGPTGVCVHCVGAAVRVTCEPSPGLDAAQRRLLKGSGGQCLGLGCRLGEVGRARRGCSWPCWSRPPPYRALSPAEGGCLHPGL